MLCVAFVHFLSLLLQGCRKRGRGAGVACPLPPDFSRSVSPISTRGSKLYPPDYYSPLPHIFKTSDIPDSIRDDDVEYLPFPKTYGQHLTYPIQKIIDIPYPQEAFCKTKLSVTKNDILTRHRLGLSFFNFLYSLNNFQKVTFEFEKKFYKTVLLCRKICQIFR